MLNYYHDCTVAQLLSYCLEEYWYRINIVTCD